MKSLNEKTIIFNAVKKRTGAIHEADTSYDLLMNEILDSMNEAGSISPLKNLVEYFISGEPVYITRHKNARSIIQKVDRYELLESILKVYFTAINK